MPQYNRRELDVKAHEYGFNRDTFEKVLRLRTEIDYMERFMAKEYKPELLFENTEIVERLQNHPMVLWKCK